MTPVIRIYLLYLQTVLIIAGPGVTIGSFRLDYEYEIDYEYDFLILVFRLHIITTHTHFIP